MGESPLQTPRRMRDVARSLAQTSSQPDPMAPAPSSGGTIPCPSCGAALSLQPAAEPAPEQAPPGRGPGGF